MAITRPDDGIWCPGSSASDIDTTLTSITGSSTLTSGVKILTVFVSGYDASAAADDISVFLGDGVSSWDELTLDAEVLTSGEVAAIFYLLNPSTSHTEIRVNTTRAYDEGVSAELAAYSGTGTFTINDSDVNIAYTTTATASVTLTGGANGDITYIGGQAYITSSVDLDLQSAVAIEEENATACNSEYYGHAQKDWSDGAQCDVTGDYVGMGAISFKEGTGGATVTIGFKQTNTFRHMIGR